MLKEQRSDAVELIFTYKIRYKLNKASAFRKGQSRLVRIIHYHLSTWHEIFDYPLIFRLHVLLA